MTISRSVGKARKREKAPNVGLARPGRPRLYKTASERQAAYRARASRGEGGIALGTDDPGQGARRVDLFLPTSAALALRRLARHKDVSQAQIMADLITKADHQATKNMGEVAFADYVRG